MFSMHNSIHTADRLHYDQHFDASSDLHHIRLIRMFSYLIDNHTQGQNPDASSDGDFMSEAKDWAGELISGQTGTGRILVS